MMNNGIKSMTNYANNYPPHINAIQQTVTQVITIPYQHATCLSFSQFFSQALCASSLFFLHYAFGIHQHFVLSFFFLGLRPLSLFFAFSWPLATLFFSFLTKALGQILFSLMQHALHKIHQYNTNINASICYNHSFKHWLRWQKRIVNGPKGLIKG